MFCQGFLRLPLYGTFIAITVQLTMKSGRRIIRLERWPETLPWWTWQQNSYNLYIYICVCIYLHITKKIWIHLKLNSLLKWVIFRFPLNSIFSEFGFSTFIGILRWFTKFSSPPDSHPSPIREGGHQVVSVFRIPKKISSKAFHKHATRKSPNVSGT